MRTIPYILLPAFLLIVGSAASASPDVPDGGVLRAGFNPASSSSVINAAPDASRTVLSAKKRRRQPTRRRYTRRGNPEVTRQVASELLIERLPELAALVGLLDEGSEPVDASAETATDGLATEAVSTSAGYSDSEMSEDEDPDNLSAATDEDQLREADLSIDDFYREFTNYMASLNGDSYVTYNGVDQIVAMEVLVDWLGTRYLFGGNGREGIDCSAFTKMMYRELGFSLPRTAAMQWGVGQDVEREELQFGDLVFFHTRKAVRVSHVGMYLGNGMFAHASSRNGVTVSSLESSYYNRTFIGARRYDVAGAIAEAEESDAMTANN